MNTQAPDPMAHYRDIGAYMRDLRLHYRLSVDEVAARLHIRPKYIAALEDGRMNDLPGRVYTMGYLQAYAEFLGLNAAEVLDKYQDFKSSGDTKSFRIVEPNNTQGRPAMRLVVGCLALLMAALVLWQLFTSRSNQQEKSMIEAVPDRMKTGAAEPLELTPQNRACLEGMSSDSAYPPCYMIGSGEPGNSPLLPSVRAVEPQR